MRFNPPHLTLRFWKNLQLSKNFCRARKIFFLKCPKKNYVQKFFWKFSKSKQRRPSEGHLCLDLTIFKKFQKEICTEFFSGHFKKKILWALQKFSDTWKFFQKLKCQVWRVKTKAGKLLLEILRSTRLQALVSKNPPRRLPSVLSPVSWNTNNNDGPNMIVYLIY